MHQESNDLQSGFSHPCVHDLLPNCKYDGRETVKIMLLMRTISGDWVFDLIK